MLKPMKPGAVLASHIRWLAGYAGIIVIIRVKESVARAAFSECSFEGYVHKSS